MGLFKKPNRKFRQRVTHTDSEDEETQNQEPDKKQKDTKTSHFGNDVKDKTKAISKGGTSKEGEEKTDLQPSIPAAKLLSFHDEEDDGEVFKLKKSNYSRRLTKQLEKERKKRQENPVASTSSTDQNNGTKPEAKDDDDDDKALKNFSDILSGKEAEDMDVDDEDEDDNDDQVNNPFKDVLQSGVIPDAATIYAMKKHRQLAREMKDFIPLEQEEEKDEESQSRLIREDDNDRSDDDEDDEPSRLSFNVNSGAAERQKVREAFLSLQEESQEDLENEDAAELERWEREQIRKGVSIVQSIPTQPQPVSEGDYYSSYLAPTSESQNFYPQTIDKDSENSNKLFLKAIQESQKSNLTTDVVKARLQERLTMLKEVHEAHKKELEDVQKEIERSNETIKKHEEEAPENAERFQLYQQLRGYVRDLVECLDMKVAHVDLLESRMMDLYKERSKALIDRRQQDVKDQADEFSSLSSKVLRGNTLDASNEKNNCQDETKLRRAAEREGRRIRRRKARECNLLPSEHHDGMSSDDEQFDTEIAEFKEKKENLLQEAEIIFDDVVDEFGTLDGVMFNFEKWKQGQNGSYNEAYVSLCLPKIFAPFVRIELLCWNPLEENLEIENSRWYESLASYGHQETEEVLNEDDADLNLLPAIIEKAIIPKITAFIKDVWDPTSAKQTTNLINLIKMLNEEYLIVTHESKPVQTMLQSVWKRIEKSLDEDVFIPLYPKELLENKSMGSAVFFRRQFWFTVKLLRSILSWHGILADAPLQDMSISSLLNRYLVMGLNTSTLKMEPLEMCLEIVASFPKGWFSEDEVTEASLLLKQFSQFLVKLAPMLNSRDDQHEDDIRSDIVSVVQLLISIGSFSNALSVAKQFNIAGFKKELE